jgi:hypothetical protein
MACAHRGCKCQETSVRRGTRLFCGERYADLETSGKHEARCPCGHRECGSATER